MCINLYRLKTMAVGFYVTAIRGKRVAWLAGPFDAHDVALALVPAVRVDACHIDPWCDFDQFGTARLERDALPAGVLDRQTTRKSGAS